MARALQDLVALVDLGGWSIGAILGLFLGAAAVILVVGTLLTKQADHLADRTGMGEAIFGAVLLGGSTSLPGIVTSISTAYQGFPQLAASNAIGGIAVQTAFLAIADITYRKANLEHSAASIENLIQGALLCSLLALNLVFFAAPPFTVFGVHPGSALLLVAYGLGIKTTKTAREAQLWAPRITKDTKLDEPTQESHLSTRALWVRFTYLAGLAGVAGYLVGQSGIAILDRTGLSASVVGALMTGVSTSLPELVVAIAAVRRGALTLAVAGIIGGNTFDVLFLALSDIAYHDGSIYHAFGRGEILLISLTIVMTAVLVLGLLRRERHGPAGIGFESLIVLVLYGVGVLVLAFG